MANHTTMYKLNIYQLDKPYSNQDSLSQSQLALSFESDMALGDFHVGETITSGPDLAYLGRIQHIHHSIGDYDDKRVLHEVQIYLFKTD